MSQYRDEIVIEAKKRPKHPINHGVDMQAHHLVSHRSVQIAAGLGKPLIRLGYNIDTLKNLVLLPSTLPGACHLKVQLHRGNHTGSDDDHPFYYHTFVAGLLIPLRIEESAGSLCTLTPEQVQKKVDWVSTQVLDFIKLFDLPLTKIHRTFKRRSASGCCGKDNVDDARTALNDKKVVARCPHHRDHGFTVRNYTVETYGK